MSARLLALLFVLSTLLTPATSLECQYNYIVNQVNRLSPGWTAALCSNIPYNDDATLSSWLGAIPLSEAEAAWEFRSLRQLQTAPIGSYPANLDLRLKYSYCPSIGTIRNQSSCGSCWAFAAMNSLTDRWCIAKSSGAIISNRFFSVEDVLECCADCNGGSGNGCYGGIPSYAMKYARDVGVSTGDLKTLAGGFCKPYFLDGQRTTLVPPACGAACTNGAYGVPYAVDRTKISGYGLARGEQQMIAALNNGGTVAVAFAVYQDFYAYRSGIYSYVTGKMLGGHAVRLIGYGEENGVKYWLLANSWGRYWGEAGFFRMRRGTNECGLESYYAVYGQI